MHAANHHLVIMEYSSMEGGLKVMYLFWFWLHESEHRRQQCRQWFRNIVNNSVSDHKMGCPFTVSLFVAADVWMNAIRQRDLWMTNIFLVKSIHWYFLGHVFGCRSTATIWFGIGMARNSASRQKREISLPSCCPLTISYYSYPVLSPEDLSIVFENETNECPFVFHTRSPTSSRYLSPNIFFWEEQFSHPEEAKTIHTNLLWAKAVPLKFQRRCQPATAHKFIACLFLSWTNVGLLEKEQHFAQ